ncbi:MAG: efflux RND transporter periplasmic adaptor subunit [Clostridia bacterium]|jgi:HlyD family secretion protein
MGKRILGTIWIIVMMLLSLMGCTGHSVAEGEDEVRNQRTVPVEVEEAAYGDIVNVKEVSGKLQPVQDIMIIPKVPGIVSKVHVKIGQKVKKDDLLLEIDGSDIEMQVAQAQAAYDAAKANVDLSRSRLNELNQQKKEIRDSINKLEEALKEIEKGLKEIANQEGELAAALEEGKISKVEYDTALAQLGEQKKLLEGQKKSLAEQKAKAMEGQQAIENTIKQLPYNSKTLDTQLKQAKVGLDNAKKARGNFKLYAPIDGVVASLTVEEGEMVSQAAPPVTVINLDRLVLDIHLTEFEINRVKEGQKVDVYIDAIGKEAIEGTIDYISPVVDPRSQGYPVRIIIENDNHRLKAGMFARSMLPMEKKENVLAIPKRSVANEDGSNYVYIVNGDQAKKVDVELGIEDGDRVEVLSGIESGTLVVTKGQEYIDDQTKINIVRGDSE